MFFQTEIFLMHLIQINLYIFSKVSFYILLEYVSHAIMEKSCFIKIPSNDSFTQRDVNEGRVWYIHTDKQGQDSLISDQLLFSVADSSHPPNILSDQAFVIQVEPSNEPSEMSPTPGVQLDITVGKVFRWSFELKNKKKI